MELPSITIVTPCLNAAGTLERAIQSVASQGYPRLEHVVVDGGSSDGTVALARNHEHLRVVSEPDRGRADAVNKGVRIAGGDVIGFLNADDRYEPGALRAVGEAFAAGPGTEWVTGYCRIVDGAGREIRRPVTAYKNLLLRHFSFPLYLTQNFVSDPATFVRRDALEEVGPLDERYRISHDYDLWLRLTRRGAPVVLRRTLSNFEMSEGTMSMAGFESQFREHAAIAREHGEGRKAAVTVNAVASRLIVLVYRVLRGLRRSTTAIVR